MTQPRPAKLQRGAMMLEALIGILIFSTGILALIGMQALSIAYASDAKYRADASFLANQIVAQMWVDRTNALKSPTSDYEYAGTGTVPAALTTWVANIENTLPGATSYKPIITVDTNSASSSYGQVSVTVRWRPANAESERNHRTIALISNPSSS